ncbi:DEAD/DEAH box helicase [Streptomyces sp. SL13]|uniref:DEAD/DEAH box helicase n=1 Tax=Streptantibioticus silvisoli TaxID=2705255 RepID=A0AA90HAV2_9ACTN|nr:DEAD/DEAH box helicase [Streptantibioticus silvisoli]MDI5971317.1 DEAD/DEAH box helicase [Streptantibioticus silvisoli]
MSVSADTADVVEQTADVTDVEHTETPEHTADAAPVEPAAADAEVAEPAAAVVEDAAEAESAADAADAEVVEIVEAAEPTVTFSDLGLPDGIVRKLAQNGVTTPFPIQAATIPDAMAGKDILGRGRTGSGKTLSFGLPLLTTLSGGHTDKHRPRGIILTPTRELAMQVSDALQPYGDLLGLKLKVVCGGTSMANQIYALERGVDILVATPGRLRDLIDRGACALDRVQIAVLDEADQMADMGFLPEVTEILDLVPAGGQRLLFSATLENEIDSLVKRYLVDPVTHEVDAAQGAVTTMTHHVLIVKPKDKAPVTAAIAARKGRTIIFVRTQMGADRVAEQLRDAGVRADALHGGMTQGARTRTLADFKDGYVNVLVATDVAARGIHVDGIDLVLNVDPAGDHKDYLHRSGRTARAGQSGTVVSLALPHQRKTIFRLMEDAGVDASRHIVGGAGAFDEDVAKITGARSLTEVQADAAANAAQQAEREVADLTRELEKVQRRAVELRDEAVRLTARAARERGETVPVATADGTEAAEGTVDPAAAPAPVVEIPAQATAPAERVERRDQRGNYERRPSANRDRDDRRPSYGDRDDRRPSYGDRNRDDRRPSYGDRNRDDRRPAFNRDRNGDDRRPAFNRDRDDRPTFNRDRDDRRPSYGDRGGDDRRPAFNRDRNGDDRRPAFNRDRNGERPAFNRDRGGDDRRPAFNGERREHRGGDRPFNRDRRDERPAFNRDRDDRRPAYGRHDDHRGPATGAAGTAGTGSAPRSFDRRADKPRWKRNG